mmetsp:Transcript_34738/g.65380  ORF Transcript_34738/g.65380 Transcript_34738/m.65380 type:complete len:214 (+) Transcript_34738:46-687(+)
MSVLETAALQEASALRSETEFPSEPMLHHPLPDQGIGHATATQSVDTPPQPQAGGTLTDAALNSQVLSKLPDKDLKMPAQYLSTPSTNQLGPSQVHATPQPGLEHRVDGFVRPLTSPGPHDNKQVHGGSSGPVYEKPKLFDVPKISKKKLPPMRPRSPPVPPSDLTLKNDDRPKGIKITRRTIIRPEDKEVTAQGKKPERQSSRYKITHYKPK